MTNADRASERDDSEGSGSSQRAFSDDQRIALLMRAIEPFAGRTQRLFDLREQRALLDLLPEQHRRGSRSQELLARSDRPEALLEILDVSLGARIRHVARRLGCQTSALNALVTRSRERFIEGRHRYPVPRLGVVVDHAMDRDAEMAMAALVELEHVRGEVQRIEVGSAADAELSDQEALQRVDTDGTAHPAAVSDKVPIAAESGRAGAEVRSPGGIGDAVVTEPAAASTTPPIDDGTPPENSTESAAKNLQPDELPTPAPTGGAAGDHRTSAPAQHATPPVNGTAPAIDVGLIRSEVSGQTAEDRPHAHFDTDVLAAGLPVVPAGPSGSDSHPRDGVPTPPRWKGLTREHRKRVILEKARRAGTKVDVAHAVARDHDATDDAVRKGIDRLERDDSVFARKLQMLLYTARDEAVEWKRPGHLSGSAGRREFVQGRERGAQPRQP